jgi:hypothetical protein
MTFAPGSMAKSMVKQLKQLPYTIGSRKYINMPSAAITTQKFSQIMAQCIVDC